MYPMIQLYRKYHKKIYVRRKPTKKNINIALCCVHFKFYNITTLPPIVVVVFASCLNFYPSVYYYAKQVPAAYVGSLLFYYQKSLISLCAHKSTSLFYPSVTKTTKKKCINMKLRNMHQIWQEHFTFSAYNYYHSLFLLHFLSFTMIYWCRWFE